MISRHHATADVVSVLVIRIQVKVPTVRTR